MRANRTHLLLAAAALIALAAVAYFLLRHSSTSPIRNYPSAGTDIIVFGDSLASGYGAPEGQDLSSDLSVLVGQPVINLGKPGDTTSTALARVSVLDQYKPKVVVIVLGGNDYLQHLSMDDAFTNLGKVVEAAQARGATVLLVGLRISSIIGNFDSQFSALSQQYQTAYVADSLDGIFGNKALMSDDIHPNAAGYQQMADRIAPTLIKLLK